MTDTSLPISLALLNFAGTLARRDPDWFRPELSMLSHFGPSQRAEEAIIFRLADQAVRVWGASLLELSDRKFEADALRALSPIIDDQTSALAAAALGAFDCALVSHARDCAASAGGQVGTPDFIGSQAAYAAIALANRFHDARKHDVYESAAALLAELRTEEAVVH